MSLLAVIGTAVCLATGAVADEAAPASEPEVVGNKSCPVSGYPVNKDVNYVHNGKQYGLCGGDCVKTFSDNPEKYSAIADTEVSEQDKTDSE